MDSTSRDYTQEQEKKYGLVFNYPEIPAEIDKAIDKAEQILTDASLEHTFTEGRKKLLADKIDVTGFLKNYILNLQVN